MAHLTDTADLVEIEQLLNRIAATADLAEDLQDYLDNLTDDVVFEFAPVPAVGLDGYVYTGHEEVLGGARKLGVNSDNLANLT